MKIIKHLILFCFVVLSVSINAQIDTKGKTVKLSSSEKTKLDKHLKKYKTFTFDKSKVIDSLNLKRKCSFSINIDETDKLELSLELNDLRGEKYKATFISDSGEVEFKGYFPNTYKGKTKKGEVARFTIDKENFYGTIINNNQTNIIKSAKLVDASISEEIFVVFDLTDVIKTEKDFSPDFTDALEVSGASLKSTSTLKAAICTYYLEVATDADFEYFQAMGSNLTETYSHIFSVLNIIEGVYESTFDLRLVVTFQNVWTISTDPYTSTDYTTVCNELRNEWEANRTTVTRDIAHLFTGKSTNSGGAAWRAHIGDTWSYGFSRNRDEMFETTAHEIGHNIGARDVNLMSIVPPECLCGSESASVMCQGLKANNLWFCDTSINEITPFLSLHTAELNNPISSELNLTETETGFNEYQARDRITSTQVIDDGVTIYKSDEIILNGGFEVKLGAEFEIKNDDTGCD
jgi:hypothetical protein